MTDDKKQIAETIRDACKVIFDRIPPEEWTDDQRRKIQEAGAYLSPGQDPAEAVREFLDDVKMNTQITLSFDPEGGASPVLVEIQRIGDQYKAREFEESGLKASLDSLVNSFSVNIDELLKGAEFAAGLSKLFGKELAKNKYWQEAQAVDDYITEELKNPKYNGKSIFALFSESLPDEATVHDAEPAKDSLFMQALNAAKAAAEKAQPERTIIKRAQSVEYPLDKPNHYIWNLLEASKDGQFKFSFDMTRKGNKEQILTYCSIILRIWATIFKYRKG